MESAAPSMLAVVQQAYGLEALALGERPMPTPGPGQVRIRVSASTVNPMDWHLATGNPGIVRLAEGVGRPRQGIPGREACGVVDALGPEVTAFQVGQRVFGWLFGAYAEYAIAAVDLIYPAPTAMPDVECAALPVAGATAFEALELGDVAGKRVLVNGASGGVGHFAIQIAKALDAAFVAGVCSSANVPFVESLGADEVLDYNSEDFTTSRWDVILDCIGNRSSGEMQRALVDDGCWIVVGDLQKEGLLGPLPRILGRLLRWRFGTRTCRWFVQGAERRYLEELAGLADAGLIRTHLSGTVGLSAIRDGYARIESGRTVGKIAVNPRLSA